MKRVFLVLVVGTVLVGAGAPVATADDQPSKYKIDLTADGRASVEELEAFVVELQAFSRVLDATQTAIGQEWRQDECRFQSLRKGTWTQAEERLTAQCVLGHWPTVSYDTLDRIIECESHWVRGAFNPAGPYVGLGQHVLSSWDDRLRAYEPRRWEKKLKPNWRNSRSMLVVTVRMMGRGLSPWGCA